MNKKLYLVILILIISGFIFSPDFAFACLNCKNPCANYDNCYFVEFGGYLQPIGHPYIQSSMQETINIPYDSACQIKTCYKETNGYGEDREEYNVFVRNTLIGHTTDPNIGDRKGTIEWLGTHNFSSGNQTVKVEHRYNIDELSNIDQGIHPIYVAFICDEPDEPEGEPELSISKSVNKSSAEPGEIITYIISYKNNGDANASNVEIEDDYDEDYLSVYDDDNGSVSKGKVIWEIGDLEQGESGEKVLKFRIKQNIPEGTTYIYNDAEIDSDETSTKKSNRVRTKIYIEEEEKKDDNNFYVTIKKSVKNISRGDTQWYEQYIHASPSDLVSFRIEITSESDGVLEDIMIKDNLPSNLLYQGNLKIDGDSSSKDISETAINLGDLESDETIEITFLTKVADKDNFTYGNTELINTALTYNDDGSETDTVKVIVKKTGVAGISTGITNNFLLDSIFLPLFVSAILVFLFKSKLIGLDNVLEKRKIRIGKYRAEKTLARKLSKLNK